MASLSSKAVCVLRNRARPTAKMATKIRRIKKIRNVDIVKVECRLKNETARSSKALTESTSDDCFSAMHGMHRNGSAETNISDLYILAKYIQNR